MFKKIYMLFKIGRKLSISGATASVYEIYNPPLLVKIIFFIIGFKLGDKKKDINLSSGAKLCNALQEMGTTFIKLGQFLATRPDIIGESTAKDLEKLQDKLPAFKLEEAKSILKKELKEENFNQISKISEPIAAASIAQVHFAKIKVLDKEKEVAFKILRPKIEKIFNEELDALLLLAYIIGTIVLMYVFFVIMANEPLMNFSTSLSGLFYRTEQGGKQCRCGLHQAYPENL